MLTVKSCLEWKQKLVKMNVKLKITWHHQLPNFNQSMSVATPFGILLGNHVSSKVAAKKHILSVTSRAITYHVINSLDAANLYALSMPSSNKHAANRPAKFTWELFIVEKLSAQHFTTNSFLANCAPFWVLWPRCS